MNYSNIYQPNPLSERFLNWLHKKRSNSQYKWENKPCISIDDARLCCRLSQCYQEVLLTKRHLKRDRVLVMSRVERADRQLREAISQIPALSEYSFSLGDPGLYLLAKSIVPSPEEVELPNPDYLPIESIDELPGIFQAAGYYSFYKRFRRSLGGHFTHAARKLQRLVEQYRFPGAFSWNAAMGAVRIQRENVRTDFMDDYVIHPLIVLPDDESSHASSKKL